MKLRCNKHLLDLRWIQVCDTTVMTLNLKYQLFKLVITKSITYYTRPRSETE